MRSNRSTASATSTIITADSLERGLVQSPPTTSEVQCDVWTAADGYTHLIDPDENWCIACGRDEVEHEPGKIPGRIGSPLEVCRIKCME